MDWGTIFGGLQADLLEVAPIVVPIGIGVFAVLASVGLAFRFLRKAGVRG